MEKHFIKGRNSLLLEYMLVRVSYQSELIENYFSLKINYSVYFQSDKKAGTQFYREHPWCFQAPGCESLPFSIASCDNLSLPCASGVGTSVSQHPKSASVVIVAKERF